jgi:hypothetical protein
MVLLPSTDVINEMGRGRIGKLSVNIWRMTGSATILVIAAPKMPNFRNHSLIINIIKHSFRIHMRKREREWPMPVYNDTSEMAHAALEIHLYNHAKQCGDTEKGKHPHFNDECGSQNAYFR